MPAGAGPRRTPGLRREEVATLAGVSVDYYIRLEQGKERNPGAGVLTALAAVLRLNEEELAYLHDLARHASGAAPPAPEPTAAVPPGIRQLLERVRPCPAYVLSRTGDVMAANPEVLELFTGMRRWPAGRRNTVRYTFCHPAARDLFPNWEDRAASAVANLRTVTATDPEAPDLAALVAELRAASSDFARLWERHDVQRRRGETKGFAHPRLGLVTLTLDVLYLEGGQRVGVYQARPGSADDRALKALARLAAQETPAGG